MRILTLIGKRLLAAIPVLLMLTAVVFVLQKLSGINPARAELKGGASEASLQQLEHQLWLDRSLPLQYLHYLDQLILHGSLGTSVRTLRPVTSTLATAIPATVELAFCAAVLVLILSLLFGLTAALASRGSSILRFVMIAGASAPVFLLAIGGIYIFYGKLHWLPASGRSSYANAPTGPTGFLLIDSLLAERPAVFVDALEHLILPAIAIALVAAVAVGRVLRSSLSESLAADYTRTARSKGLSDWGIVIKHTLRNSLTAPLAMTGLQFGLMFAGVVVVESIFAWPGIGNYAAESIPVNDFPAIAGVTLVIGFAYIMINVVVDILQAIADPRIKL